MITSQVQQNLVAGGSHKKRMWTGVAAVAQGPHHVGSTVAAEVAVLALSLSTLLQT